MQVVSQYKLNKLIYEILSEFDSIYTNIDEKHYTATLEHFIKVYIEDNQQEVLAVGASTFGSVPTPEIMTKLLINRLCAPDLGSQYQLNFLMYEILTYATFGKENYDINMAGLIIHYVSTFTNADVEVALDECYGVEEAGQIIDKRKQLRILLRHKLIGKKVERGIPRQSIN